MSTRSVESMTATTLADKAAEKEDYTPQRGILTIPAGSSTGTILISATQDDVLEKAETFEVTLKNPVTAKGSVSVSGTGSSAMSKIPAHGTVAVSVAGPSGSVEEGDEAVFTLVLSGKVSEAVMVNYAVDGVTASSPLTIDAEETRRTFTVQTTDNTVAEASKTVTVTLPQSQTLPSGVGLGTTTATATNSDNDPLTVSLEGPKNVDGVVDPQYTVMLKVGAGSGTGSATVEVDYEVDSTRHTLEIEPGPSSKQIPSSSIDISDKAVNDTLTIRLRSARTAAGSVRVGTPSAITTTFVDSNTTTVVNVAGAGEVAEGENATFAVTSGAGAAGVVVQYRVVPGSANSADYQAPSGRLTLNTSGEGTITVRVRTDDVVEAAEEFSVELTSENGPDVVLGTTTASAMIMENAKLTASMTRQPETVLEGGSVTYVVSLSGKSSEDIVIDYTVGATTSVSDDDAEVDDYTAPADARLRIPARQTSGTIVIQTVDDDLLEPAESFQVTLGTARPTELIETPSATLTTTIRDSGRAVTVSVAGPSGSVEEGDEAVFTLVLSGKVSEAVMVNYAVDGVTASSPLTIDAEETRRTFTVQTTDNTVAEASKTVTVTLPQSQTLPSGVGLGTTTATATISDNDSLTVSLEGPKNVDGVVDPQYTVMLKVGAGSGTGSATVEVDYEVDSTRHTLEIEPGPSSKQIPSSSIDISDKAVNDTLTIRLRSARTAAGSVRVGTPSAITTTFVDSNTTTVVNVAGAGEVAEGENATFAVTSGAGAAGVVVQYRVVPGSANSADYQAPSGRLTLNTSGEGTITVRVRTDDVVEAAEEFSVELTSENGPDVVLGTTTASAMIMENAKLTASMTRQPETVLEGGSVTYVVSLSGKSSEDIVIDYTVGATTSVSDDDAEVDDYTAPADARLRIPARQTSGTIVIQTVDDDLLEPAESFQVTLGTARPTELIETPSATLTTTIRASDSPITVDVKDTTVDEGETAMFTVELSGPVDDPVSVSYSLPAGTGATAATGITNCGTPAATDDYCRAGSPTPLVIPSGERTGIIEVETFDDTLAEASETFTLTLDSTTPSAGISFGKRTATATITDDALTATVVGPTEVAEGADAVYTVSVTGGAGDEDVTVTYSTEDSTATAGEDFSPGSDTVTIPAGDMSAMFTIQILADDEVDLGETLELSVVAETADGMVRAIPPAPTTILDGGSVQVSIMADQPVVAEGQPATFTVELSGTVSNANVTLPYTIGAAGDTATADDYNAPADQTVVIPAGEMSQTISVTPGADGQDEPDETLSVSLQGDQLPEGVAIATGMAKARVRITDHEIRASVTADQPTVDEGSAAVFTVRLTVDRTPAGTRNRSGVEVHYAMVGTATAPGDYDAPAGTLMIAPGQDTGTITIETNPDDVLDPGETLVVRLTENTSVLGAGLVVVDTAAGEATTTILDGGSVKWSVADVTVEEGNAATFMVTLDDRVQRDVTLTYETLDDEGTATAGSDYTAVRNQVTVTGGTLSATFMVETMEDRDGESSETIEVRLTLLEAPAGVEPLSATATATIMDDDIALLPLSDVTMTEGETEIITLTLERALPDPVMLHYTTAGSASEEDYSLSLLDGTSLPPQGMIPLPANIKTGAVNVRAVDDELAEGTETFMVELWTVPVSGGQATKLGMVQVTIEDNDELSASVTVPEAVAEGETARFTVTLGGGTSTASVVVSYTVGGTAKAPGDYVAPSESLTIQSGESSGTIPIQTNTDNVIEPDETLVVTLTAVKTANGAARVGSPRSATTAIQDPVFHSFNRVNQTLLPGVVRASAASALEAVSWRMAEAAQGDPPAASADLAGLTGLYRALLANERALQDGSYDLAKVLGGSSFLVPLSSHDGDFGSEVGIAVWGGGDFRTIGGGAADTVDWDGSVWSARLGADMRFVDSLLTGIAVSWASGALDYVDATPRDPRVGTYATWLVNVHPYVGWTTPDFGLWASGGFGFGGVTLDDSEEDAQEADLTQWSVGAGGSVTLLSTDWFIAGGTTAVKLKAEGFLAGATVAENESKVIQELTVGVNQARAAIEASHAQHFAGGGSLRPSLEIGGRFDGGDGETGAGLEVGGGLTYADPGSGLTVAGTGRALVIRDGNYGEWGLSGLIQLDPNAAGHGLMMSVRPTFGVTASGVSGLWEHGTLDLLSGGEAAGGRVEAEIGYGLAAFGTAGVLTPYAGASLTDAGAHSLSLGGRLELGPAFDLTLELERSDSADPDTAAEHDITLEGLLQLVAAA